MGFANGLGCPAGDLNERPQHRCPAGKQRWRSTEAADSGKDLRDDVAMNVRQTHVS
jgi:hypothetical protein